MSLRVCSNCKKSLLAEAIREWRPFSCPNCRQIISPRTRYVRYGTVVFWVILVIAVFLFSKVTGLIIAILLGALTGGVLAFCVVKALNRFRRRESLLTMHENHLPPVELRNLAALAEGLAELSCWTEQAESGIRILEDTKSYDEEFEDVVIESGRALQEAFTGVESASSRRARSQWATPAMSLEEWRVELGAIARDIRLAAGDFESEKEQSVTGADLRHE